MNANKLKMGPGQLIDNQKIERPEDRTPKDRNPNGRVQKNRMMIIIQKNTWPVNLT